MLVQGRIRQGLFSSNTFSVLSLKLSVCWSGLGWFSHESVWDQVQPSDRQLTRRWFFTDSQISLRGRRASFSLWDSSLPSVQHDMNAALLSDTYTPHYCGRHGNSPVCWARGRETEAANQNAADSPYPPAENEWKLTSTVYQWSSSNPSTADAGWTGMLPAQCVLWSRGFWEEEALTWQSYPAGADATPAVSRKGTLALLTPHHTWGR